MSEYMTGYTRGLAVGDAENERLRAEVERLRVRLEFAGPPTRVMPTDEQVDAMLDAYLNHTHANGQAGIWYRCLACDYETDDFNDALRHPMRSALAAAAGGDDR